MTGETPTLSLFSTSAMRQFEVVCLRGTLNTSSPLTNFEENTALRTFLL